MSTITVPDIPLTADNPAQRLRRIAAAVRVSFTWWGVHRMLNAQQREEMGDAYSADVRFLTAGKKIIDVKHQAFRKLTAIRGRVVSYWRGITLPFVEPGTRLIKQADIDGFVSAMHGFRGELVEGEADLNGEYDQIKADARRRLGRLYDASDYPPEIRGMFDVQCDFPSVEAPSYLMRLNPTLYAEEQARIARRFEQAIQLAEEGFIAELGKLVSHLSERITGGDGEKKIFRDSAITNLTEFFQRFRDLNIRSNAQLDALVEQAQQIVRGVAPQDLRDNAGLRQHVATQLSQVQSVIDGMMVDRPRRTIVRHRPSEGGA